MKLASATLPPDHNENALAGGEIRIDSMKFKWYRILDTVLLIGGGICLVWGFIELGRPVALLGGGSLLIALGLYGRG